MTESTNTLFKSFVDFLHQALHFLKTDPRAQTGLKWLLRGLEAAAALYKKDPLVILIVEGVTKLVQGIVDAQGGATTPVPVH